MGFDKIIGGAVLLDKLGEKESSRGVSKKHLMFGQKILID